MRKTIEIKAFRWALSLLLVVMFVGSFGINANADTTLHNPTVDQSTGNTEYSYIWFGSYPMTEIFDEAIIESIDSQVSGTAGDCVIDNVKYRKISWDDATYHSFWSNNGASETDSRYFRFERIRWRVLEYDSENNKAFIMADKAVDCCNFNDADADAGVLWNNSTIRTFLNGYDQTQNAAAVAYNTNFFTTAFSVDEASALLGTTVKDEKLGGTAITDKIVLLTYPQTREAKYGFLNDPEAFDKNKQLVATDYAQARGTQTYGRNVTDYVRTVQWWTSSMEDGNNAIYMNFGGNADHGNVYGTDDSKSSGGVVPAAWVDLSALPSEYNLSNNEIRKIHYELYGGVNNETNPSTYTVGEGVASFAAPTAVMRTFEGWYLNKDYFTKVESISATEDREITLYAKWIINDEYVNFGSYPSSEVTDPVLIEAIDAALGEQKTGDCTVENARYRKCKREDCTSNVNWMETGCLETDYRYFKFEPIRWRVLKIDSESNRMLLLATKGVDFKKFDKNKQDDWRITYLREWLHGRFNVAGENYFIDAAFSESEKEALIPTGTDGDKVFMLSEEDVLNPEYGFSADPKAYDKRK